MDKLKIKRAYDPPSPTDGTRFLVDRYWPRGMKKENLGIEAWLRNLAPSGELCKWFGHDPARWEEFSRRYAAELEEKKDLWQPLLERLADSEITLLYGARDEEHNNAVALREYLRKKAS
jgi:uncharacterized protein YeaO (DUF488 family)